MALTPGTRLGPYEILSAIGVGGMGEVYRARDTRLDRDVAIKILPEAFAADAERVARFQREAKVLASLNHPNIAIIHGLEHADGAHALVMEFVEGEDLAQRIVRGAIPLDDALPIAKQIAEALEAAHEQGIIHRDLKPANIKVRPDGTVKVLDFGLAKEMEPVGAAANASQSPTITTPAMTQAGMILGTPAYMSPEQVRGQSLDKRTDIWAFGCVSYEMLAGCTAFGRGTPSDTIAAVLEREPDWDALPADTPPPVYRILQRSLAKDRRQRLRDIGDVRLELDELLAGRVLPRRAPVHRRTGRLLSSRPVFTAAVAIALVVAAAVAVLLRPQSRTSTPAPTSTRSALFQLTKDGGYTGYPALSADGKLIAYVSDRANAGRLDLWVQQTGGAAAVQLTHDYIFHDPPIIITPPSFSPDGTRILFASSRESQGIYEVPALGGEPRLVIAGGYYLPQYSPNGEWISYGEIPQSTPTAFIIPAAGGGPRQIHPEFLWVDPPIWSPDGRLLFLGQREAGQKTPCFWVASLDDAAAVATDLCREMPGFGLSRIIRVSAWVAHDELVFSALRGDSVNLWRARLSRKTWKLAGAPVQITFGTGVERWPSVSGRRLAFSSATTTVDLAGLPLDANRASARGPLEMLTRDAANDFSPSVSRDGSKLVYSSDLRGNFDVYLKDLRSGGTTVVAGTPEREQHPFISPDGARVVYSVSRAGQNSLNIVSASGGNPRMVCADCGISRGWSADGSTIMLWNAGGKKATVSMLDLRTETNTEVLRDAMLDIMHPALSPDDHWIAFFVFNSADTFRVFVAPWRPNEKFERSSWIAITPDRSRNIAPAWSPDGNLLYFNAVGTEERVLAQRLDPKTKRAVGAPILVPLDFGPRQFLRNWNESVIQIARDRMVFATQQDTSNIWLTELP